MKQKRIEFNIRLPQITIPIIKGLEEERHWCLSSDPSGSIFVTKNIYLSTINHNLN